MPVQRWIWTPATIKRVVDGDTYDAELTRTWETIVDLGFGGRETVSGLTTFTRRLRLDGVDAPKASTVGGKAATAFAEGLVLNVSLEIETLKPYKYRDEYMARITLPDGRNLTAVMIETGHAFPWSGTGPAPGGGRVQ